MKPILVGFSGKAKSGKDTAADIVKKELEKLGYTVEIRGFASALKELLIDKLHFPPEMMYDQNHKNDIHPAFGISGRQAMQIVGTEMFRNKFHSDTWVKLLEHYANNSTVDYLLITDVRFYNEAEFIISNSGFLFNIVRDFRVLHPWYKWKCDFLYRHPLIYKLLTTLHLIDPINYHPSETADLSKYHTAHVDNLGTLEDLKQNIDRTIIFTITGNE